MRVTQQSTGFRTGAVDEPGEMMPAQEIQTFSAIFCSTDIFTSLLDETRPGVLAGGKGKAKRPS